MELRFATRTTLMNASVVQNVLKLTSKPDIISFAGGLPAPESFPVESLRLAADKVFRTQGREALQYGPAMGYQPLREKIAVRMEQQGIPCSAENVLVLNGSQQGLDLAGKAFLEPGDLVVCENPTYTAALSAFRAYECGFLPIDTDDKGMIPEDLERKLAAHPNAKLVYVIPSFQNPTGRTWSLERRKSLLALAKKYNLPILEDNPYGDLRYEGEALPSLKSMDTAGLVTYMGSFSKVLAPGVRLGWLIAAPETLARYATAKSCSDLQSGTITQLILNTYLEGNDLDANIRSLNALYGSRRDLMLSAMKREFPDGVSWTHPCGGLFLWVTLPEKLDSAALMPFMLEKKVAYIPGQSFFAEGSVTNTLRMSYSNATEEKIRQGVAAMAQVFRAHL